MYCKGCGRKVPAKYRRKDGDCDTVASRSVKKAAKATTVRDDESSRAPQDSYSVYSRSKAPTKRQLVIARYYSFLT